MEDETEQWSGDCARGSGLACGRKSSSSLSRRSVGSVDFGMRRSRKRPNETAEAELGLGERRRRSRIRGAPGVRSVGPGGKGSTGPPGWGPISASVGVKGRDGTT